MEAGVSGRETTTLLGSLSSPLSRDCALSVFALLPTLFLRPGRCDDALGGAVAGSRARLETMIGGIRPEIGLTLLRFPTTDIVPSRLSLRRQAR